MNTKEAINKTKQVLSNLTEYWGGIGTDVAHEDTGEKKEQPDFSELSGKVNEIYDALFSEVLEEEVVDEVAEETAEVVEEAVKEDAPAPVAEEPVQEQSTDELQKALDVIDKLKKDNKTLEDYSKDLEKKNKSKEKLSFTPEADTTETKAGKWEAPTHANAGASLESEETVFTDDFFGNLKAEEA